MDGGWEIAGGLGAASGDRDFPDLAGGGEEIPGRVRGTPGSGGAGSVDEGTLTDAQGKKCDFGNRFISSHWAWRRRGKSSGN